MIGFCHRRGAVRTFRVDRIRELSLLEQGYELPAEFDIQSWLEQEQATRPGFPVKLRFAAQAASMAREFTPGWEEVEEKPDGCLVVTMTVPDLNWAASTTLAYGPLVQVVEPPELRSLVRDWAQALVTRYAEGDQAEKYPLKEKRGV